MTLAKRTVDATRGSLAKLILTYTIPLFLTTIIQHLFDIVDKAVLGNMADTVAVAAVGATTTITSLIINGFVGLSTGTSIVLARFVGQRDERKIRSIIDTSLLTGFLFGILVALIGVLLSPTFLTLTDCPSECYEGAVLYIRIYVSAAPFTLLYNFGSAVLRTLGDTRRPLVYITVSGVINAGLNIILCIILPQKVAAVAIATAVSKIVAAVLVLNRLCHLEDSARVSLRAMRFHVESFLRILRFGVPASISNLMFPLANLQIVSAINSFGVDAVAGQSASSAINNISHAITGAFGTATTTFMGQNIGAQNKERVKKSFWWCLGFGMILGGAVGIVTFLTGRLWMGLMVGFSSTAAIEYGMIRMQYVSTVMFVSGANSVLGHALQAYGYPAFQSVSSILFTLGFRVLWMQWIYPYNPTFEMIMACFTVSWTLNMLFYAVIVAVLNRRYNRGVYKKI